MLRKDVAIEVRAVRRGDGARRGPRPVAADARARDRLREPGRDGPLPRPRRAGLGRPDQDVRGARRRRRRLPRPALAVALGRRAVRDGLLWDRLRLDLRTGRPSRGVRAPVADRARPVEGARARRPLLAYRLQLQRRRWRYTRAGGQTIRLWTGAPELVAATAKRGLAVVEPLEPRGLLEGLPGVLREPAGLTITDSGLRAAIARAAGSSVVRPSRTARGCRRREARAALGGRARALGLRHRASQRGCAQPGGLPAARRGARLRGIALRGRAPPRHRLRHATVERDVRARTSPSTSASTTSRRRTAWRTST